MHLNSARHAPDRRRSRPAIRRRWAWTAGALAVAAALSACGSSATSGAGSTTSAPTPSSAGSTSAASSSVSSSAASPSSAATSGGSSSAASGESLDALYQKAKAEGSVTVYGAGGVIPEVANDFEKAYPGIKVNNVDATDDALVARAIAEAKGNKVIGDVWQTPLDALQQMHDQNLLADPLTVPEADGFAANLKGTYWVASDEQFLVGSWNTDQVAAADAPQSFTDFADPKWKGKLIAEPRDYQLLEALAKYKFKSDSAAEDFLKKLAANDVKFQNGHNTLDQMVASGQAEACITCYSNHYPPLAKKGAPVAFFLSEGVGQPNGTAVLKGAPHPNAALLFTRWVVSADGQKSYAANGRIPALSSVKPTDNTRPQVDYSLSPEDLQKSKPYSDLWNQIFDLR